MLIYLVLVLLFGAVAFVRLAPSDPAAWNVAPAGLVPETAGWSALDRDPPAQTNGPVAMPGGAYALVQMTGSTAAEVLRQLDTVARATPRTVLLAGEPEQGLMTWVTRSAIWGFPDYTTAQAVQDGPQVSVAIVARQRFGSDDLGVNAARISAWLAAL